MNYTLYLYPRLIAFNALNLNHSFSKDDLNYESSAHMKIQLPKNAAEATPTVVGLIIVVSAAKRCKFPEKRNLICI